MTGILYSLENGIRSNLVKHYASSILFIEPKHFAEVPRDGFSLTVFITCQPNLLCLVGIGTKVANNSLLVGWYLIVGLQCV